MLANLRKFLDATYRLSGAISAMFLIAILVIIVLQMVLRWAGATFPGAANYAGYCMAAASFFMLAHALNEGAHIRVSIVLNSMGRFQRFGEIWCYGIAALTATFFARYAVKTNFWSWKLNDISQGQDAIHIWIPQLAMSFGTILLAVALWDHLLRILFGNHTGVGNSDTLKVKE